LKLAYHRRLVFFLLLDLFLCIACVVTSTLLFHNHQSFDFIQERIYIHSLVIFPRTLLFHLLISSNRLNVRRHTALYHLVKILAVRFLLLLLIVICIYELHSLGITYNFYSVLLMDILFSFLVLIITHLDLKCRFISLARI
jgi:hypothetical protein